MSNTQSRSEARGVVTSLDGRILCSLCLAQVVAGKLPGAYACPACTGASPGLGDMLKAGLSAVGITEERVSKAIGRPCGCSKRAAKLNELGHRYLGLPPGTPPPT